VRAVLQACDAQVALTRLGKLLEDDRSLEVERDWQRLLDLAGWHRRLDRDRDSDLDSILDSTWIRGGEQVRRKATAAQDDETERTWDHRGFGRAFSRIGRGDHDKLHGRKEEWVPLTKLR
jgi:hypothetical protein